jgi:hypothetical protein
MMVMRSEMPELPELVGYEDDGEAVVDELLQDGE